MIFPSSSSSDEEESVFGREAASLAPGIFVNLCPSESEDEVKNISQRYFNCSIQPRITDHPPLTVYTQVKPRFNLSATPYTPSAAQDAEPSTKSMSHSQNTCKICTLSGHQDSECSLKWRQYKLKTVLNKPMLASVSENLNKWCYYCAQSGHFGDDCMRNRLKSQFTAFHTPLFSLLSKATTASDVPTINTPSPMKKRRSANSSPAKPQHKQASNKRPKLAPNNRIKLS